MKSPNTPRSTSPPCEGRARRGLASLLARLVRGHWGLGWNRFTGWVLLAILGLVALLWHWENWRSARELREERARLVRRLGTDSYRKFAPPVIADADNFFALPEIEAWSKGGGTYDIPEDAFWPEGLPRPVLIETEDGSASRVDWEKWASGRALKGETPAQALNRALGDANGLLPKLAAGLDRPFSRLKPGLREALEASGGDQYAAVIPNVRGLIQRLKDLTLHLRAAAHSGDAVKAATTARIVLRLFPEAAAAHGSFVSGLVGIAVHGVAFEALQDALSCPVWDERALSLLQAQLARDNDLHILLRCLGAETLWMHQLQMEFRERTSHPVLSSLLYGGGSLDHLVGTIYVLGPIGWRDADAAHHLRCMLDIIGPDEETAWIGGSDRANAVRKSLVTPLWFKVIPWPNPRRLLSSIAIPNIGNVHEAAAKALFHRRCLIIACELEKHRLRHGSYPQALPEMREFEVHDPARPKQPPGYRLEPGGYLLWSAGPDQRDDRSAPGSDWPWRMLRR